MSSRSACQVLLIQPPVYDFTLYDLYLKSYGLYRIADWFSSAGYEVTLLDCLNWDEPVTRRELGEVKRKSSGTGYFPKQEVEHPFRDRIGIQRPYHRYGILHEVMLRRIGSINPDIICVTTGMTYWYQGVWEVLEAVQELHPRTPVVAGGVYASLMGEHLSRQFPEVAISRGSGLDTLKEVLARHNLPVPGRDLPKHPGIIPGRWHASAVLRLHEGCPCRCDYCASAVLTKQFLQGDPYEAARWVEELCTKTDIRDVAWYDDALLVNKERGIIPFLEEIIARKLYIRFYTPNGLHIEHIDGYTAELMNHAGFQEVRLGFESASDDFHTRYDRKTSLDELHTALNTLLSAGFSSRQIRVYLLAGLPGQQWEEVDDTLSQVCALGIRVSIAEYSPVPGTALWEKSCRVSPYPLVDEPLFHNNTIQPVSWEGFSREHMSRLKSSARTYSGNL